MIENVYTKIHNSEQDIHVHDEHQHGDRSKKEFKKMLSLFIMMFLTFGFFLIEIITGYLTYKKL